MSETDYPSWRDALADDSKIANLRCAIKYVFWHGAYLLLALLGVLFVAGAKVLDRLSGSDTLSKVGAVFQSPKAKKVGRVLWGLVLVFCVIAMIAMLVAIVMEEGLIILLYGVAYIVGLLVLAVVCIVAWEKGGPKVRAAMSRAGEPVKRGASKAGSKAVKTPGVRRVYGNCPVHLDLEPKWFKSLFE